MRIKKYMQKSHLSKNRKNISISFSWMYTLDLVLNVNKSIFGQKKNKMIKCLLQFDKSKRPNI